jgi:hypothetical protein
LLASTSALAATGSGVAAGTAHATSAPGATLTETLSTAQSSQVDNQGTLYTVLPKNGSPADITVNVGAVPNGNVVTLLGVDCGDSSPVTSIPADGVVHCRYTDPAQYKITVSAAVNNIPGLSTSRTAVVSRPPGAGVDRFDGQSRYGTGVATPSPTRWPASRWPRRRTARCC